MEAKLVSVIIPCYNLESFIIKCISSVWGSSYNSVEVIVVDDGSTDQSVSAIRAWEANRPNRNDYFFRLIQKENGGASSARNAGLENCSGEYIAFIDGDDWISEDYIEDLVARMEEACADLCVGGVESYDMSSGLRYHFHLSDEDIKGHGNVMINIDKQNFVFCNPVCKMFSGKIIRNHKLRFDTRLAVAENISFNLDYIRYANSVSLIGKIGYTYRIREGSLIHKVNLPETQMYVLDHFQALFECHDKNIQCKILENNPIFLSMLWDYGILNRIMGEIRKGEKRNVKDIIKSDLVQLALTFYKPKNKKDKIFLYLVKNNHIAVMTFLVWLKYYLNQNNGKMYGVAKKIMLRK